MLLLHSLKQYTDQSRLGDFIRLNEYTEPSSCNISSGYSLAQVSSLSPVLLIDWGLVTGHCALELQTKVHPKICNHGEGPHWGILLVESAY